MYEEPVAPFNINKLVTLGDLIDYIMHYGCQFVGIFEDDIPHGDAELFFDNQVRLREDFTIFFFSKYFRCIN